MAEHQCKCRECSPEAFPERPQDKPYYRFMGPYLHDKSLVREVRLNGQRVARCREAVPGKDGWVTFLPGGDLGEAHVCSCMRGVCEEVARGHVEVDLKEDVAVGLATSGLP